MTYNNMLIHRCTVLRRIYSSKDTHGHPVEEWVEVYTNQPCRFTQQIGWTGVNGMEYLVHKRLATHQDQIFFPPDVSLRADYRITNIRSVDGELVDNGPFNITEVRRHFNSKGKHHIECILQRVTEGGT